jgi:predicted proteasome-type protease
VIIKDYITQSSTRVRLSLKERIILHEMLTSDGIGLHSVRELVSERGDSESMYNSPSIYSVRRECPVSWKRWRWHSKCHSESAGRDMNVNKSVKGSVDSSCQRLFMTIMVKNVVRSSQAKG